MYRNGVDDDGFGWRSRLDLTFDFLAPATGYFSIGGCVADVGEAVDSATFDQDTLFQVTRTGTARTGPVL